MTVRFITADCRIALSELPSESVQCVVTSPPYWGLRDYGVEGQLGLEATPDAYVATMVAVFEGVWRVLKPDGVLWLNLGDSYAAVNRGENARPRAETLSGIQVTNPHADIRTRREVIDGQRNAGIKVKDLVGIPWMMAFALRAAGWWLRQDVIWSKPNPMPESVTDRCTKSHEYLFMLTKSQRYLYDAQAIKEPIAELSKARIAQATFDSQTGGDKDYANGTNPNRSARKALENFADKQSGHGPRHAGFNARWSDEGGSAILASGLRNRRSVWTIPTSPLAEAHFATFPPALVEPCLRATAGDGLVLDPFGGAGTTALVADRLGLDAISIDANAAYTAIAERRLAADREKRAREAPLTLDSL